jgi:hypothetical protein
VNADSPDAYVVRLRPNDANPSTPFSVPHFDVTFLGVDANYVYWFEPGINGDPGRMRRASRSGDGSDVVTIPGVRRGVIFSGFFWTSGCTGTDCTVQRTPVIGGSAEEVSQAGYIIGFDSTALYLGQPMDANGHYTRILSMTPDGATQILTDWIDQPYAPVFGPFVVSGGALYWTGSTGELHTVPTTGGTPALIPNVSTSGGEPFAVVAGAVLYGFDGHGYKSAPL